MAGRMAEGTDIDFVAEGLLDDLEGEAREARLGLLTQLSGEGVPLAELRDAVAAGHLALLPVERAIAGDGPRYSAHEIAEIAGVDLDLLLRLRAALGVPYSDPAERLGTEADLETAWRTRALLDAGFPPEELVRNARAIGMAMARVAEANRELVVRNLAAPGDNERDLANRLAEAATLMLPMGAEFLNYAFRVNLLEQVKRDVIGAADLESGEIGGAVVDRSICFADLVEFTSLGEEIAPEELGGVAERFEELAIEVVKAPVRLVKTIGDAVMLVSVEAEPLVETALDLVAAGAAKGDQFPILRAGIATGPTLPQAGDFYGRSVNLASRVTGVARPGSVLVDTPTREATGEDGFDYSFAGERRLKGIDARQKLFRVRREGEPRNLLGPDAR